MAARVEKERKGTPALTPAGEQFIAQNLDYLRTKLSGLITTEDDASKKAKARLAAQITHLEDLRSSLVVISRTLTQEKVDIGSVVTIVFGNNRATDPKETYLIVPSALIDPIYSSVVGAMSEDAGLASRIYDKSAGFSGKIADLEFIVDDVK